MPAGNASRPASKMRTLFGENIFSPAPTPPPPVPSTANPFELSFQSTSNATGSSVDSAQASPAKNDWLTQHLQNSERQAEEINARSIAESAAHRYGYARRSGSPRVLFMGLSRSGKSSIQKVIFEKLSPAETLYLGSTNRIEHASTESFIRFESAEIPAGLPLTAPDFDSDSVFASAGAIVWVLDMQDEYFNSISQLISTAVYLLETYPRINFEVFIHKADGLSEEYRHDTYRDVRQRVQDELADAGHGGRGGRDVTFYQTSIFDHSVFEAMSKVFQRLLPQLPAMEALLLKFCSTCRIQKAYLLDTMSKFYLATDPTPTFLKDYEVCSDYVDMIVDIKQIYGWRPRGPEGTPSRTDGSKTASTTDDDDESGAVGESLVTFAQTGETYMYAREINDYFALICIMGPGSTPDKRPLIDYNVSILQDALVQIFSLPRPS